MGSRIASDTDFGINRIGSESISIQNFYQGN